MATPTGKYKDCKHWDKVLGAAKSRKGLRLLAETYEKTGHPGCLNAIMDSADADLWITYYTGK